MTNETKHIVRLFIGWLIVGAILIFAIIQYSKVKEYEQENERLNSMIIIMMSKLIWLNHQKNELEFEVDYLRKGNEQLIKNSIPCSVIKSIKKTPLPKLKGTK